jgi:hypothetical protein
MPRKHHSKKRLHRRSQRGGDWFGSSSTPSSTGSGSSPGWFSGITNKAKGLTSSISSFFGSSSTPSSSSTASGYQPPPQQPSQYGQQGQYAGRKRRTRKLGRHGKSRRRR